MNFKLIAKMLVSHIRRNPARMILSVVAMMASACVVVWVVSGYDGLLGGFEDNAHKYMGRYDILLVPQGGPVSQKLVDDLKSDPALAAVELTATFRVGMQNPDDPKQTESIWAGAPVNGQPPMSPSLVATTATEPPFTLHSGNWFNPAVERDSDAVGVLTANASARYGVKVGDTMLVTTQANQIRVKVVGIVEQPPVQPGAAPQQEAPAEQASGTPGGSDQKGGRTKGKGGGRPGGPRPTNMEEGGTRPTNSGGPPPRGGGRGGPGGGGGPASNALFVPWKVAERISGLPGQTSLISIVLKEGYTIDEFKRNWEPKLKNFRIVDFEDVKLRMTGESVSAGKRALAYSATGMAMLAAVFIIFTTLSMGVSERARELAVLRAIALTRFQVASLIATESLLLATIGWLGGLGAGYAMLKIVSATSPELFPTGVSLGFWTVVLSGISAYGGALAAAVIPAWRATRLRPLEAMAPMRSDGPRRWPYFVGVLGLILIAFQPVLIFVLDLPKDLRTDLYWKLGYPSMSIGFLMLSPLLVILVEKYLGALIARVARIEPKLLQSQLSSNLWRTLGTTLSLSAGLSIFVLMMTLGYSMLKPFYPGDWLPDMMVRIQPTGIPESEMETIRNTPGVKSDECLPLAVEQARLAKPPEPPAGGRGGSEWTDNVVIIGLDPAKGFGGSHPLLSTEFLDGDRDKAIQAMIHDRGVLIPDTYAKINNVKLGDSIDLVPPNNAGAVASYKVCGILSMPGWQWMTKFSGVRRNFTRTGAMMFAAYEPVKQDFKLERVEFVWMNMQSGATHADLQNAMQAIAEKHSGEKFKTSSSQEGIVIKQSVKLTGRENVRSGISTRADGMIWEWGKLPLIGLGITSIGVIGTIVSSIRARRYSLGVLRALGVTRLGLSKLVLAEGLLIGIVVCVISLGFGLLSGWCAGGFARFSGGFGGSTVNTTLVVPWGKLAIGIGTAIVLCLAASLWPAFRTGRTEPLKLLQAGRAFN